MPPVLFLNGRAYKFQDTRQVLQFLLDNILDDPYSPWLAKRENLARIFELLGDFKRAHFARKLQSEMTYEKAYWDNVLATEQLATLPGFSTSAPIEKGASNYNPEKRRITDKKGD